MSIVLDASMTIAWLFTTERAVSTETVLRRISVEGAVVAYEQNLTLYDAAYLELAMRCQYPLASCDTALIKAAQALEVEVLTGL